ncbi:MAG: hypothetical protein M1817_003839 [Caeruleum heppii]|nr:MAG: hypothetical protein M1817_003839 [Caeruleum heppii]
MPSSQSTPRSQSKSTNNPNESTAKTSHRKSSAYHGDFEQHLVDHGIYPADYDFPDDRDSSRPNNEDEILHRLNQSRSSLSPSRFSDDAFRVFVRTNARASTEARVMSTGFPIIAGEANAHSAENLAFGNLEPLTDGTLVDAKPDFYDGAPPAQIDRRVRADLSSYIIPSTQRQAPALPNFFAEAKGPKGSAVVAKRQACYDGAIGARGIHQLRSFQATNANTIFDNNAYTITSTYHDGLLKIYTSHPTQSTDPGHPPEYHMSQLRAFALTDTAATFREGLSAFRNARDWAKDQRDHLIAAANDRITSMPRETSTVESSFDSPLNESTDEMVARDSETSADELSHNVPEGSLLSEKRRKRGHSDRLSQLDTETHPRKR